MNNILQQLMQLYAQPQVPGQITTPQTVYPVPQYKSGAIDNIVLPNYRLPNDRNTIDPKYAPFVSYGENI